MTYKVSYFLQFLRTPPISQQHRFSWPEAWNYERSKILHETQSVERAPQTTSQLWTIAVLFYQYGLHLITLEHKLELLNFESVDNIVSFCETLSDSQESYQNYPSRYSWRWCLLLKITWIKGTQRILIYPKPPRRAIERRKRSFLNLIQRCIDFCVEIEQFWMPLRPPAYLLRMFRTEIHRSEQCP